MRELPEVDAYISAAPEAQRPVLERLRARIRRLLPQAEECFESRLPIYKVDGIWTAGFATRAKGPMLYIMNTGLLDEYALVLGKSRTGKTCIEMTPTRALSLEALESIADELLSRLAPGQSTAAGSA